MEFVNESTVELVQTNASDDLVAKAAWVSFDSDKAERLQNRAGVEGLIKFLLKNKHMSPFEHGQFTFKVTTPLFVRSEHHRHRTQAYNEISGRYTKYDMQFYMPPGDRPLVQQGKPGRYHFVAGSNEQQEITQSSIEQVTQTAVDNYNYMLDQGVAKEVARMVLPPNLITSYYATVNPRNLMHFLDLRLDPTALHEIRDVARKMEAYFAQAMPLTYNAYKENND